MLGIPSKSSKSSSSGSGTGNEVDAVCVEPVDCEGLLARGSSFKVVFERDSVRVSASSGLDAMVGL